MYYIKSTRVNGEKFKLLRVRVKKSSNGADYLVFDLEDGNNVIKGVFFDVEFNRNSIQYLNKYNAIKVWGYHMKSSDHYFLRITKFNILANDEIEKWIEKFYEIIGTIEDIYCRKLLESFIEDHNFMRKFTICPGSMKNHHNYKGGLLKHTVGTMLMVDNYIKSTKSVSINRDMALTGAFLHDIGKIYEYQNDRISNDSKFFGHTVIGFNMFLEKSKKVNLPYNYKKILGNVILSHHFTRYNPSEVKPCTKEALLVNKIESLDSALDLEIA